MYAILGEFGIQICFCLPMVLPKKWKYLWYPKIINFWGYQLDRKLVFGWLVGFLLLPDEVYADVMNGLQYHVAKMQTKS